MNTPPRPGRPYVIGVIVACLLVALSTILLTNLTNAPQRLGQQGIRFVLTIGLCFFLYQGRNWARWVAGFLFGLGGLVGLVYGVALLSQTLFALILVLQGLIYLGCVAVLFLIPSVRAYFARPNVGVMPEA